jgi:N-acetylglucosaminyldiphosphoundecaprenol N-acetyl-beta-D-mannosaminyltransferase
MKLLLAGYYGVGNIGDEAILRSLVSAIKKDHPQAAISVLSADPAGTSKAYDINAVHKYAFVNVLKELKNSDAFILGGGGLIQDSTSIRSLLYYLFLIISAKILKKKVILLGQGIGPVRNKYLLKWALKGVDLITVRDERSLKELTEIKAKPRKLVMTADLSFMMAPPDKENSKKILGSAGIKKTKSRLIGISLRPPVKGKNIEAKYKAMASLCDHLMEKKDSQLVFLIFNHPDDLNVTSKVMGMMKNPANVILKQLDPAEMLGVIAGMDAVIGMRLHSLIFSAIARVPGFGLSYDPKVESFQRQTGQKWIDLDNLNEKELIMEVDRFIDGMGTGSFGIDRFSKAARENIRSLNECLKNNKISVLDINIDNLNIQEALKKSEELLASKEPGLIVTPNPEMIVASLKDIELRNIINNAYLSVADGVGLMLAGRILGRKFKQRIAGIDLMLELIRVAKNKRYKIFLFGSREGVAEEAAKVLDADVAGTYQGYSMNNQQVIEEIKSSGPDMLFVGLGSPKQEKWAADHLKELGVPLVMCVGGSLDVIAGRAKRAPVFMRKIGIEWLWRLIAEPRRWKRMLVLPVFIIKVIRSRF